MHYIIYPDTLFLEHLICNLCLLFLMRRFLFPDAGGKRIFLAGTLAALCNTAASVLFFHSVWILKSGALLPAVGMMILGCMGIREPGKILYFLYQMSVWTLVLGGVLRKIGQWTDISPVLLCASAAVCALIFGAAEKLFTYCKRQNECMREIVLCFHGNSVHVRAFADTGNQLFDPVSKKPVSVISGDAWEMLTKDSGKPVMYYPIPYQSLGNPGGMLPGVSIDSMIILHGEESRIIDRPVIAVTKQPFSGIFHYSVLLHNEYC